MEDLTFNIYYMILDKEVSIKITRKNINYYKLLIKNIELKTIVAIKPCMLQEKSNIKLSVKCDICNDIRFITYQAYNKNLNSSKKYKIYTCDKCSHIKLKETNLEKYGVEYYSKHPDRNNRVRETSIEKWGAEHFSKTNIFKEKVSKTNLEKFGVINPFMDKKMIKEKFTEKYGVDHPSKVKEIYDRIKSSNLKTTGYESPLSSPEIREIIKKSNLEKYGVDHHMKENSIRIKNYKIGKDESYLEYNGDNISTFNCEKGHIFFIDSSNYHNRKRENLDICTVCYPISNILI